MINETSPMQVLLIFKLLHKSNKRCSPFYSQHPHCLSCTKKRAKRLLERYWSAKVFTFTLSCWCILFLARSHHLMGAPHFITIYKAIQWCPQSSWHREEHHEKLRMKTDKKLTSSTSVFNSILFRKNIIKKLQHFYTWVPIRCCVQHSICLPIQILLSPRLL